MTDWSAKDKAAQLAEESFTNQADEAAMVARFNAGYNDGQQWNCFTELWNRITGKKRRTKTN